MLKSSNLRIRIDPELHREFLDICRSEDKPAAQVLREFMRNYVEENRASRQQDFLFVSETGGSYENEEK